MLTTTLERAAPLSLEMFGSGKASSGLPGRSDQSALELQPRFLYTDAVLFDESTSCAGFHLWLLPRQLNLCFLPPLVLYGFVCQKFPPRKLLLWSVMIGVPQFIPMAFIHNGRQALVAAVLIGLMGGMANVACIEISMRACPPGLQGTLMMIIASTFALSMRGGDVFGTWIYGLSPAHGFTYCVIAITLCYALILPVIPFIPKQITSTADGEPNPEEKALVLSETLSARPAP